MGSPDYSETKLSFTEKNTAYMKKPVKINALQWKGETDLSFIKDWVESFGDIWADWFPAGEVFTINTLESNGNLHTVSNGDFIIRGLKGEYYACKPDIFDLSYEKIII